MFNRRKLAVIVPLCIATCLVWPTLASADEVELTSLELFNQAVQHYEAGQVDQAKTLLERVDEVQLPREQRVQLYELREALQNGQAVAAPTPEAKLAQADAAARAGELAQAIGLYQEVIDDAQASSQARARAAAGQADARRAQDRELTEVRRLLDEATNDVRAGRLDAGQAKLDRVRASGVQLGWFDQERLDRQTAIIASAREAEAAAAAEAAARVEAEPAVVEAEPIVAAEPESVVEAQPMVEAEPVQVEASPDLLQMAQRLRAQERLAEGRQAEAQGQMQLAIAAYADAVRHAPDNQEARTALALAQAKADRAVGEREVLDTQLETNRLRRDATVAEFNQLITLAEQQLQAANYPGAIETANQAKLLADNNRAVLPPNEYRSLRDRAVNLSSRINQQQLAAQQREQTQVEAQRRREADVRLREARREQQEQVQSLLQRAAALRREQKYTEALSLVNQALVIEPTNVPAQAMRDMLEDTRLLVEFRDLERKKSLEIARQTVDNTEAIVPYSQLLVYPSDWPKITATRLANLDTGGEDTEVNRRTALQLRQSVPRIDFQANRLDNVLDFLQNVTGVNMFVNWQVLETAGVEMDLPITLRLSNVPAEQALTLVLRQASAVNEFEPVGYSIIDGIVTISTERDLTRTTDTRVYDIRDLLVQVPNFSNAPQFDLRDALDSGTAQSGGGGGGGGQGLFGDRADTQTTVGELTRAELIAEITSLIQDTIGRPEDWAAMGGTVSSLRELNGNLIVKTTPQNHRGIVGLLAQLRETRAIQIAVEARFLLVDKNFLDEFGVDLDLQINNIGGNFGPIQIAQDTFGIAGRGTTGLPGTFGDDDRSTQGIYQFVPGQGFPGQFGRSFEVGVSYLDDLEVNLLLRATQAHRQSIALTAPRVTFFNGQRAYVVVARQIAFISDLEPIPDAGGFDPELSVVNSGVVLDVEGTISADRRYVTLTVRPSLATVTTPIRSIPILAVFTIPTGNNNNNVAVIGQGFIEAPEVELTSVNATVSVPDQGTLLLGGQRLVGELEVEAGVPVLSKIPILNRLFTNTTTVKDERSLLILIRPTIIIQSEEEERLFPGLLQNPQQFNIGAQFP